MADRVQNKGGWKVFEGLLMARRCKRIPEPDERDLLRRIGIHYFETEIKAWEAIRAHALKEKTQAEKGAKKWDKKYTKACAIFEDLERATNAS